jgi:hypothetical protein
MSERDDAELATPAPAPVSDEEVLDAVRPGWRADLERQEREALDAGCETGEVAAAIRLSTAVMAREARATLAAMTAKTEGETATERTTMEQPTENQQEVRHAGRMGDDRRPLCGATTGRATRPKESINCPECRIIVNFVRETYPHHAGHTDWRLTPEQERKAIARMAADMYGGADD